LLSQSFKNTHPHFISGGKYSSNPSSYLKYGYTSALNDDLYNVSKSSVKDVFLENTNNSANIIRKLSIAIILIILGSAIYLNKIKIYNFFKKSFKF